MMRSTERAAKKVDRQIIKHTPCCTSVITRIEAAKTLQRDTASLPGSAEEGEKGEAKVQRSRMSETFFFAPRLQCATTC